METEMTDSKAKAPRAMVVSLRWPNEISQFISDDDHND
jgi:hypothetical protein